MSEDEIRKEFEKLYVACANSSNIYRDQYGEYESIEAGMAWWGYLAAWNAALDALGNNLLSDQQDTVGVHCAIRKLKHAPESKAE